MKNHPSNFKKEIKKNAETDLSNILIIDSDLNKTKSYDIVHVVLEYIELYNNSYNRYNCTNNY